MDRLLAREYEFVPAGRLTLVVVPHPFGSERLWTDGASALEASLPEILEYFSGLVPRQQQMVEEARKRKIAAEGRERLVAFAEERNRAKQVEFQAVLSEAAQWEKSARLEQYLEELKRQFRARYGDPTGAAMEWFELMREFARRMDPFPSRLATLASKQDASPGA